MGEDKWIEYFERKRPRRDALQEIPKGYAAVKLTEGAIATAAGIAVSSCSQDLNTDTTPKNLIISLFSTDDDYTNRKDAAIAILGGNADFVDVTDYTDDPITAIINKVKEYIADKRKSDPNFTLDNLLFNGHGNTDSGTIEVHLNLETSYGTTALLDALVKLHNDLDPNVPLASRIIFGECDTFANISPDDVSNYQERASVLQAQIVGAVSLVYTPDDSRSDVLTGYFVRFNPDGTEPKNYADGTVAWDDINNPGLYHEYCTEDKNCEDIDAQKAWFEALLKKQQTGFSGRRDILQATANLISGSLTNPLGGWLR